MTVLSLRDLQNGIAYLVSHPEFLLRCVVNAARMRVGLPIDGLRWLLDKASRGRLPEELQLLPVPPGLHVATNVDVMGTNMAIAATIAVESVLLSAESIRLQVRVRDLSIRPPENSPMAGMIAMMDLSKPGDLLSFMPMRPAIVLDAQGDLFVLDLMKLPKLAKNPLARRVVAAASEVVAIREFATEEDLLVIGFRAMPLGLFAALGHLRNTPPDL
jgi:hypothetical protein